MSKTSINDSYIMSKTSINDPLNPSEMGEKNLPADLVAAQHHWPFAPP